MRKFRSLKEKEYIEIKKLLDLGLSVTMIEKMLSEMKDRQPRSSSTISNIQKSSDYKDYKRIVRNYYLKAHPELKKEKESQKETPSHDNDIVARLDTIINLQKQLVELWKEKPKRKWL